MGEEWILKIDLKNKEWGRIKYGFKVRDLFTLTSVDFLVLEQSPSWQFAKPWKVQDTG